MRKEIAYNDTWKNGKLIKREVYEITYNENDEVINEVLIEVIEYGTD